MAVSYTHLDVYKRQGMNKLTLRGRFHFQDGAVLRGTLLMENDSDETKEILPGVYAGA